MGKTVNFDECRLQMERPLKSINLSEDSDDDSDQRQLFELPKRKVKRPSTSVFKKKIGSSKKLSCCGRTSLCCKVCFSTLVPIFVATFIAFTVIFFIVLTMGMSGINKELEGLKIRVSYAEGAEKDFNSKRDKLRKDFEDKLSQLDNEKKKVQIYKDQINILQNQVRSLNSSIQEIRKQPVFDVNSVKSDLDKIKTGMADIGSSISKLENNHIVLEKRVSTLSAKTHKIQNILTNVTSDMNNGNRAIPSLRSTTVKPFVVTLTPNENSVVKFKQFKRAIAEVEEKQKDLCQTQSEQFWKEISNLKNRTTLLNETYLKKFENLKTLLNEKDAIATKAPSTDSLKATPSPSPTTTTTTKKPTTFHSSSETTLPNTKDDSPKNDLETIDSLAQDLNKRRRSIYKKRNA